MTANYHTHTVRCHHADGSEREYIERAIEAGLQTLGFSDHVPMPFADGHQTRYRVLLEEASDYVSELAALRDEYSSVIEILIGFEAEYYPACFDDMMRFLEPLGYDYLILGQHYTGNETDGVYTTRPTDDAGILRGYVEQTLTGLSTGVYTYFAHPDILNFTGDADIYRSEMTRLCEGCLRLGIPLELNCLGVEESRCYPRDDFFDIAARVGNTVIPGCDAHHLRQVANPRILADTLAFAHRHGIEPAERVLLRNPKTNYNNYKNGGLK